VAASAPELWMVAASAEPPEGPPEDPELEVVRPPELDPEPEEPEDPMGTPESSAGVLALPSGGNG
jgi:hypothetical protein